MIFQSEIENLLTEISSYEALIASKRSEIEHFQSIGDKISQGANLLEEAIALATNHGHPDKAVAAIQSHLTSLGLSSPTTDPDELARVTADRDNLLQRIANESEHHYKEVVRLNQEKSKAAEEYERQIDLLDKECHGLQRSYDRMSQENHQLAVELQSYQRRVAGLRQELSQYEGTASTDGELQQQEEAPILEAIALANSQVEQQADPQVERADSQVDSSVEQQSGENPSKGSFSIRINGALSGKADLSEEIAQREFANAQARAVAGDESIYRIELRQGSDVVAIWPEPIKDGDFETEEAAQGTVIQISARISYVSAIHTAYFGGFNSQESAITWLEQLRNCFAIDEESVVIREAWQGDAPTGFWEIKLEDCSEDGVHLIVQNCPLEAESWERLSDRVWFQTGQTVLLFKTKKQATLWGKQVGLMLGLNWSVNASTVSDTNLEAFKAELRVLEMGNGDALALSSQNLDSDPQRDSFKLCPGNLYRKAAIEKLVARLKEAQSPQDLANIKADRVRLGIGYEDLAKSLSLDERARIDQIRQQAHKAA